MHALIPVCVVAAVLATPLSTRAAGTEGAATSAARELAAAVKKAGLGNVAMLSELRAPKGDADAASFIANLGKALLASGLKLVDKASVVAALNEAAVAGGELNESALAEVAGAFGAHVLIVGSVDKNGTDYFANLRAVSVAAGTVLASASAKFGGGVGDAPSTEARTLEAQLRRLADRLNFGLDGMAGDLRYQRVAVLPFEPVGPLATEKQLGLLVSAELTTALRRDHGVMVVERAALTKVIDELALGQSGLTDPSKTVEAGKLAGAQGLIIGTVADAGDRYLVNARVVSVDSGQVAVAEDTQLPAADLVALSSDAVVLRSKSGAVFRSLLIPGWGQFYNREAIKGTVFIGAEALAAGAAAFFHMQGTSNEDKYQSARDPAAQQDYIDKAESAYGMRRNLIIAAVVIHAVNILDALISGKTYENAAVGGGGGSSGSLGISF